MLLLAGLFLSAILYTPAHADTHLVTNCADSGAGSLRQAMADASSGDLIFFDIQLAGTGYSTGEYGPGLVTNEAGTIQWFRIILNSELSTGGKDNLLIYGSGQTREANNTFGPRVEIRAASGMTGSGLVIYQSSNCTIEGLAVNGFNGAIGNAGIEIDASTDGSNPSEHNQILKCYVGTTATGETAYANRIGVLVWNDSYYNQIGNGTENGRNLISGNANSGVHFIYPGGGSAPSSNEVVGNYIGFGKDGEKRLINGYSGVWIQYSDNNIIGKPFAGGGNVILGINNSSYAGVLIEESNKNYICNNIIGLTASGALPSTRGYRGVTLNNSSRNYIGWAGAYQGNVISGAHNGSGFDVYLTGTSTWNAVAGNIIGFSIDGETEVRSTYGIYLETDAQYNLIGTSESGGGNVVTGGIYAINLSGTEYTGIYNNIIGLSSSEALLANKPTCGIRLNNASYNIIGGTGANQANVVSGAGTTNILFNASSSNELVGNLVGTDSSQTLDRGGLQDGIGIGVNSFRNTIGPLNVIVYNGQDGIAIGSSNNNTITGNFIGTDSSCSTARGNVRIPIYMNDSSYNIIGPANVVAASGAGRHGFEVISDSNYNQIKENYIGTDPTGIQDLGNTRAGIYVSAPFNTVGPSNIIAFNNENGVWIDQASGTGETVTRNSIYSNTGRGIVLSSGGNHEMASPEVITADYSEVTGLTYITGEGAPNNGTVEVFKAEGGQGKTYLGSVIAGGTGQWSLSVSGLVSGDAVTATGTTPNPETSEFSPTLEVITTVFAEYQPDNLVATLESGADYVGEGIINTDGTDQTRSQSLTVGESATAYVQVNNAGNASDEVRVKGPAGSGDWSITYYDSKEAGSDITSQVTGAGWLLILVSGESSEIRLVAQNSGSTASTLEALVTSESTGDGSKKDAVGMIFYAGLPLTELSYFDVEPNLTSIYALQPLPISVFGRKASGVTEEVIIGTTTLSADDGTITPESIADTEFSAGVWNGDVILSKPGLRRITAVNGSAVGTGEVLVLNATREFTSTDLGIPGMTITIPAGAASQEVSVSASTTTDPPGDAPPGFYFGGDLFNIIAVPTEFLAPVTVTIPVDASLADPHVYYWNGSAWSSDGINVVSYSGTSLTFTTEHFTVFAVMAALDSNLVRFGPNPYNPNSGSSARIWYWLPADAATSIYIVNLTGTLVWKNDYAAGVNGGRADANIIAFDGRDQWGHILGDGAYLYKIVQGGKSVGGGKIAIIKK